MVISHEHRFIFVKTFKTAGTSIEVFLSPLCGDDDVVTPIDPPVDPHVPRNYLGWFNPFPEVVAAGGKDVRESLGTWRRRLRFYNHIPAYAARERIGRKVWDSYFTFCVERNPWEKVISHFAMMRALGLVDSLDECLERGRLPLNRPLYTEPRGPGLLVDRVLRYESLDAELGEVVDGLGLPWPGSLSVRAKGDYRSDRRPYTEVYTDEQRAIVEQVFAAEIAAQGYVYGAPSRTLA
jgi:hypothetical protein